MKHLLVFTKAHTKASPIIIQGRNKKTQSALVTREKNFRIFTLKYQRRYKQIKYFFIHHHFLWEKIWSSSSCVFNIQIPQCFRGDWDFSEGIFQINFWFKIHQNKNKSNYLFIFNIIDRKTTRNTKNNINLFFFKSKLFMKNI